MQIDLAPHVVDHLAGQGIHEHTVDGEITAGGVLLGRAEDDRFRAAAVDVRAVGAEGGDLDLDARLPRIADADDSERDADRHRRKRQCRQYLLGGRFGRDVVIGRSFPQDQVAHRAAGPERAIARTGQPADNFQGEIPRGRSVNHRANPPARQPDLCRSRKPARNPLKDTPHGLDRTILRPGP